MSLPATASSPESLRMARIAHELTTPVSLISGSLENLQESLASLVRYVEATEKYLTHTEEITRLRADLRLDHRLRDTPDLMQICAEGARRLNHVVNELRSVDRTAPPLADEPKDLRSIIDAAVAMARHGRSDQPLVVTDCVPSEILVLRGSQSLGQVLLNVVRNAFDALEDRDDARVDIEARLRPPASLEGGRSGGALIRVRDNGPGIPESGRELIFDEGVSTKLGRGGLGLGLAISRDLMVAMGGRLVLSPRRRGAEFLVEVPLAAPAGSARF